MVQIGQMQLLSQMITLIGMTIALAMIAGSLIYLESSEVDYYLKFLEDPSFEKRLSYRVYDETNGSRSTEDIIYIQSALNENLEKFNKTSIFIQSSYPFLCTMDRTSLFFNYRCLGLRLDESLIEECVNDSKLPNTQNEVLVFIPDNTSIKLGINETINLSIIYKYKRRELFHNISLKITGLMTPTSLHHSSSLSNMIVL